MKTFLEKLLEVYHLSLEDYKKYTRNLTNDDLEDYHNFSNIIKAKERIFKAIENNEPIMIYGDYDCDGITSTSILVYTFKKLNYPHIGYYIPSRYMDGYGINEDMVSLIHSKGYKLIITVDNGVAQFEALSKAKELGIDVILTDHHEIKESIPDNYTIVHPSFKEDQSYLAECGAYVSFNLSRALLGYTDDYLLSLASLATISDMMPLKEYNRDIVRLGLEKVKLNHYPQFDILLNNNEVENEKSFSFTIAPKINSLGRVLKTRQVNLGVEYFTSNDLNRLKEISKLIEFTNEKRKSISLEAVEQIDFDKYKDDTFVIDYFKDVDEGLIGLIANNVLNRTNKPCIIFTKDEKNDLLKGSARSLNGLPLNDILSKMGDLIVQFGGHAAAGGLSIEEDKLEEFKKKINSLAKDYTIIEKEKLIIKCELDELNFDNFNLIKSLEPYGVEFEEPYLEVTYPVNRITYLSNGKHIKGMINDYCSFISFNTNKEYGDDGFLILRGKLELDTFRKGKYLSFKVEEVLEK